MEGNAGMPEQRQIPLEIGYQLQRYQIERVLSVNVYGITYLARDLNLDRPVAIREFLPADLATREGPVFVHPIRDDLDERYHNRLEVFLAEARVLAKIDHPNIVRVLNVFVNHNTAYMVMLYEEGTPLSEVYAERNVVTGDDLMAILGPILDGLERVHKTGHLHCDIQPANILIRQDQSPVLINFGSARTGAGTLSAQPEPSDYHALEQHYEKGDQQGPWTDIYGLAATLYRGIAGVAPVGALQRSQAALHGAGDPLVAAEEVGAGQYDTNLLKAIDQGLSLNPSKRPQSIAAWRRLFGSARLPQFSPTDTIPPAFDKLKPDSISGVDDATRRQTRAEAREGSFLMPLLFGIALGLGGIAYYAYRDDALDDELQEATVTPLANDAGSGAVTGAAPSPAPAVVEARPSIAPSVATPTVVTVASRVAELLTDARTAMEAGHLFEPPEQNAYDKYRAILVLAPSDQEALSGLQQIAERLVKQARDNLGQGKLDEAGKLLDKATEVRPGFADISTVRTQLAEQRRELEKREEQRIEEDARRTQRDQTVDRLVEEARRALRRFQWSKAEQALSKAAELAPTAEDVKDLRDQLNMRRAQATAAPSPAPTPEMVAATPPPDSNPTVKTLLASAARAIELKQWDQAQATIDRASRLAPDSEEVLSTQVELMSQRERQKSAASGAGVAGVAPKSTSGSAPITSPTSVPAAARAVDPAAKREPSVRETPTLRPEDQVADVRPGRRLKPDESVPVVAAPAEGAVAAVRETPAPTTMPSLNGAEAISIRAASASQETVSPGDTLRFTTEYDLQLPADIKREVVEVHWALQRDGRRIGQEGADSNLAKPGVNAASTEFTLPPYMKPGRYSVEHRVRVNGRSATAKTYFNVVTQ